MIIVYLHTKHGNGIFHCVCVRGGNFQRNSSRGKENSNFLKVCRNLSKKGLGMQISCASPPPAQTIMIISKTAPEAVIENSNFLKVCRNLSTKRSRDANILCFPHFANDHDNFHRFYIKHDNGTGELLPRKGD